MKKLIISTIVALVMAIGTSALAITYTDTIIFTAGNVLTGQGNFIWSHPVTTDFQFPFDTINSATLEITSRRAAGSNDMVSTESGDLGVLNATGNSPVTTTFDLLSSGDFSTNWASGQPLNLSLAYDAGERPNNSLTMVSSVFELDYNNNTNGGGTAVVPEPTVMLLLGLGLIGLAAGKRRLKG